MRGKGVWELSLAQVYRITPPMRGKASPSCATEVFVGITPAYAGKRPT